MATRKHSIKVPVNFGNVANLVNNTLTTLGTVTITIPENSVGNPVTFTSVIMFIAAQDISTVTGATLTTLTGTNTLSGAGASTVTVTGTMANTGENWGGLFGPLDYTTYFNTNFGTGTSKSCQVQALVNTTTGTGAGGAGVYAYFEITYEYSDTAANRIQTIGIPYESQLSTLSTTANTTFATMPQLTGTGGLLDGYSGVTVLNRWIEIKGNCNNNNTTTNHNMSANFNSGTAVPLPTRVSGLGSDTYQIYQVDASALSTTSTHTFQLWNSLASRWANVVVTEYITFQYAVSGTSRVLNYIEIPIEFTSPLGGTTSATGDVFERSLLIPEPGTIDFVKGGVELMYNTVGAATLQVSAGSQASYRAYAMSANVVAGAFSAQHGLDSSSAVGAAFSLTNGENTINIKAYRSAGSVTNISGIVKLLYRSDVAATGIDTHTHTVYSLTRSLSFTTTADDSVTDSFQIPESNYWLTTAGLNYFLWSAGTAATFLVLTTQARLAAGEGAGNGWRDLYFDQLASDGELGYGGWIVRARDEFKRYPNDQDTNRMNIETSRSLRTTISTASRFGIRWSVSYSTITHTVSGNLSGTSGGSVSIDLYKIDSNGDSMFFDTTTRTGDGSYSFTVYDNYSNYYVVAYESSSIKGVSKESTPSTDFDINLSSGGSSAVTTGYAGG